MGGWLVKSNFTSPLDCQLESGQSQSVRVECGKKCLCVITKEDTRLTDTGITLYYMNTNAVTRTAVRCLIVTFGAYFVPCDPFCAV